MNDPETVKADDAQRAEAEAGIAAVHEVWTFEKTLCELERAIRTGDEYALHYRWESGKLLLGERRGKRLGDRVLASYAKCLKVSTSELSSRQKFAAKFPAGCPTQAELHTAMESRRLAFNGAPIPKKPTVVTWNAIRTQLLPDKSKPKERTASEYLKDAFKALQRASYRSKTAEDWKLLGKIIDLIENMTIDRDGIDTAWRLRNYDRLETMM